MFGRFKLKKNLGKLDLKSPLDQLINEQIDTNGISILEIKLGHIYQLDILPEIHKDPFDRLLISQAKTENCILISADKMFQRYDIDVLW